MEQKSIDAAQVLIDVGQGKDKTFYHCPYCRDEMYESKGLLICRDSINCGFTVKKERVNEG
jgi:hypothetical protein